MSGIEELGDRAAIINGLGGYPVAVVPPAEVAGQAGQGGAPHCLTDLDRTGLVSSACPGTMAGGWPGFRPSLLRRPARRTVFAHPPIPESEAPAGGPRRRHLPCHWPGEGFRASGAPVCSAALMSRSRAARNFTDAPTVCYTECYRGGRVVEDHGEVADMMTTVSMIRASALSPRASLELMRRIRREIDGQ